MSAKPAARFTDAVGHARDQLDQVRADAVRLRDEIEHEQSRPVPLGTIEERVNETVARLQSFLSRMVTGGEFVHPGGPHQAGDLLVQMPVHPFTAAAVATPEALKGWLMERATSALQSLPEPADAATRAKRIAALETKLRAAEVREVDLCWEMLDAGLDPDWRGDLDPNLVLGLEAA
jgi:hypothetical protein